MKYFIIIFILAGIAMSTLAVVAQPAGCDIRYLGYREGLADRNVNAICHDHNGLVWLGTHSGLYRYDGHQVSLFELEVPGQCNALKNIVILQIFEDQAHYLWIRTANAVYLIMPGRQKCARVDGISYLALDEKNQVYGRLNHQIYRLSATLKDNSLQVEKKPAPLRGDIIFKLPGKTGIWAYDMASGNVTRRQEATKKTQRYHIPYRDDLHVLNYGQGAIVFYATGKSLYFDQSSNAFVPSPQITTGSLTNPFVLKAILNEYISNANVLLPSDLASKIQLPICVEPDQHGNLWIGTTFGLFILARRHTQFRHLSALKGMSTRAIYGNEEDLFVSSDRGVYRFEKRTGRLKEICEGIPPSRVMLPLGQGHLLLAGEYNDIFSIDLQNFAKPDFLIKDQTYHHFYGLTDFNKRLWLAGRQPGVWRFNPENPNLKDMAFETSLSNPITTMIQVANGDIWAAGDDELYQISGTTISKNYLKDHSPGVIFCAFAQNNLLWLGTRGQGLICLNTDTKKIERTYTIADGLPNNILNCILPDEQQNLWISTNQGLSRFTPSTGEFLNFSTADGLHNEEFNASSAWLDTSTQTMYFGGLNGVTYFNPNHIRKKAVSPQVFMAKITRPGKYAGQSETIYPDYPTDVVELQPYARFIEFRLGSTDYLAPDLNKYYHKLEGFDTDWMAQGNNPIVQYTSLPAGFYTFRFKTVNRDGITSAEKQIRLRVKPVFYKTWWFIIGMISLCFAAIFGAYRYRIKEIRQIYEVKKQIADDLHDDVATSLSQISMLVKTMKIQNPDPTLSQLESLSDQSLGKLSDIVWAIDDKRQTLGDLVNRLQDFAESVFHPQQIRLRVETHLAAPEQNLNSQVRHHMVMIFKEAVTNIIRHTKSSSVFIRLENYRQELSITIENYFEATQPSPYSSGKGLESMANRARLMHGLLETDHTDGSFRIVVKVPDIFEKTGFSF
ncbi:MAG: hypothetical protein JNK77_08955 [Saprospiraceae bacterium]|nr:hypothetical protein [Saprospiraceae bacterium]